jgi:hypothetical protein
MARLNQKQLMALSQGITEFTKKEERLQLTALQAFTPGQKGYGIEEEKTVMLNSRNMLILLKKQS